MRVRVLSPVGYVKSLGRGAGRHLPLFLLAASVILLAFFAGMGARVLRIPWADAAYTAVAMNLGRFDYPEVSRHTFEHAAPHPDCAPWTDVAEDALVRRFHMRRFLCPSTLAPAEVAAARVEFVVGDQLDDPVLAKGEIGAFLDHCPGPWGCLAVEYSRSGKVGRSWPFRPEAIAAANVASARRYPYKHPFGWSFAPEVRGFAISLYPDGDLLVAFHLDNSLPSGGGVARVAPDGQPRWYRKDYSDGRPFVVDEDSALVPGVRLHGPPFSREPRYSCHEGIFREDLLRVINGGGEILEEVSIIDAIYSSIFAGRLRGSDDCDPTRLNFAHVLGEDASGAAGIGPGDLVVSLRNLSAFGILDGSDRRLKRLVVGSFHRQSGVRHLDGARFLVFDNLGTDGVHGPSRLLMVDLAASEETTVFPNDATPDDLRDWFAAVDGQFDVSADGRRALLVDPQGARAFEIRLSDGKVLNVFRQIHDLSSVAGVSEALASSAGLFDFNGIHYANRWQSR